MVQISYISNAHSVFENKNCKFERHEQLPRAQFEVLTMSLYSYFAKASKRSVLPNPNGSLLASVIPTAIKEANEAVTKERASGEEVTLSSNLVSLEVSKHLGSLENLSRGDKT